MGFKFNSERKKPFLFSQLVCCLAEDWPKVDGCVGMYPCTRALVHSTETKEQSKESKESKESKKARKKEERGKKDGTHNILPLQRRCAKAEITLVIRKCVLLLTNEEKVAGQWLVCWGANHEGEIFPSFFPSSISHTHTLSLSPSLSLPCFAATLAMDRSLVYFKTAWFRLVKSIMGHGQPTSSLSSRVYSSYPSLFLSFALLLSLSPPPIHSQLFLLPLLHMAARERWTHAANFKVALEYQQEEKKKKP